MNLALEDWLYRTLPAGAGRDGAGAARDGGGAGHDEAGRNGIPEAGTSPEGSAQSERRLFLYRNDPCVVIGRHQNPWIECDLAAMQRDGVPLVRRQSGGGTVYHDTGNLNWCFLTSREQYSQDENFRIVQNALAEFGINGVRSGRNDILVDGRKVSGSAFKVGRERCFHHGTLLMNADLEKLLAYLTARTRQLESKGIDSVRSTVANLLEFSIDIDFESLCAALVRSFTAFYHPDAGTEVEKTGREVTAGSKMTVGAGDTAGTEVTMIDSVPEAQEYYDHLQSWEWQFAKTPDFTHTLIMEDGVYQTVIRLDIHRGLIRGVEMEIDAAWGTEVEQILDDAVTGIRYSGPLIAAGIEEAAARSADFQEYLGRMAEFIGTEVE